MELEASSSLLIALLLGEVAKEQREGPKEAIPVGVKCKFQLLKRLLGCISKGIIDGKRPFYFAYGKWVKGKKSTL